MSKLHIEPIRLLNGSHADTATTGSGCFMNVIAYLNGEPQITDQSPCVCPVIRPIAIWLNDYMNDSERAALIPFIHRAMGTATTDANVLVKRANRAVEFANKIAESVAASAAESAAAYAKSAAASAAESAAAYAKSAAASAAKSAAASAAKSAAASAAKSAAASAAYAASAAKYAAKSAAARKQIIAAGLRFLEDVCPVADEPTQELIERATKLVELATL